MPDESNVDPRAAGAPLDSKPITVVFSGDLADDDRVWVARCSVSALRDLFLDPQGWVSALAGLPSWNAGIPAPTLAGDYAFVAQKDAATPADGWVVVQGISGTNAITVVASQASALLAAALDLGQSLGAFAPFWARAAVDGSTGKVKDLKLEILATIGRWYGHMEVGDSVSTPVGTASRASAFLLATLWDPAGYAAMLAGLNPLVSTEKGAGALPKVPILPSKTPPTSTAYVSQGSMTQTQTRADPPPPTFCTISGGAYDPTTGGTVDGGTIKRYGVE